jgi:D-psicose/D-tagatose/L-ribulose 3-epimerase
VKFGINTFLWTADFGPQHFHLLPEIREHGFDGVEVALFRPAQFQATAIRRAVEENGMSCTVCSVLPSGFSLIADDATVRRNTVAHLKDCIKAVADAGATLVAGPLYSPVGYLPGRRRNDSEWKWAVEAYGELGPVFEAIVCTSPLSP